MGFLKSSFHSKVVNKGTTMQEVAENEKHEKALVRRNNNTKQDYKIYKMAIDVKFLKTVVERKTG